MIGGRFTIRGRALTVTGSYDGHGRDDPPGWYYAFDDAPHATHWISATAVPHRFDDPAISRTENATFAGLHMGQKPAFMA